jgi:vacuolar-type H+-ATPase subunit I/STV1
MLSTLQKLGQLKHQTRTVYRLKNKIDSIKTDIETQRRLMVQVNTVLTIQREMAETFERSVEPPSHLVQLYAEIHRREEEWKDGETALIAFDKDIAYHLYRLQQIQNGMVRLLQEVKPEAMRHEISFDFESVYQAIQDTGRETV